MAVLKYWDGSTWQSIGAGVVWSPGDMKMTMRTTADAGWLICDGSLKSQATYPDLFEAIGHSGNDGIDPGGGNFRLPDLRRRIPVGKAASGAGSTIGGMGGSNDAVVVSHNHTQQSHNHTQNSHGHAADDNNAGSHQHAINGAVYNFVSSASSSIGLVATATNQAAFTSIDSAGEHNHNITVDPSTATNQAFTAVNIAAGVGATDANMQAYTVVNFMIHT